MAMQTHARQQQKFLKRSFFQRIRGACATGEPADPNCWSYANDQVVVELSRAPELFEPDGAIRLEGRGLPKRILLVHGGDNQFHAFANECTHGRRRLDPVPGADTVQCCSVGKSTFDYDGRVLYGPAKEPLKEFELEVEPGKLTVSLT
jgi:nitrite reductase/ring-hydroxylating ferredoxin subunit